MDIRRFFERSREKEEPVPRKPEYLTELPVPTDGDYPLRRSQEEALYRALCQRGRHILLHGPGGTGKTHMARKLFYRLSREYPRLAWVEYGMGIRHSMARSPREEGGNPEQWFDQFIRKLEEAEKDTILFIDPGFPVQRSQARLLGIRSESFDIYDYRGEKLAAQLERHLATGRISAIIYSSPNNPTWFNLTEDELKTIGEMATRYDAVVIEDLAYMCMDFRKPLGKPYEPPFQPTVAKYTDNYIIMMSASKMFSYAGQRIAVLAISDNLYKREYPALQERYRIARLGDALVLGILYAVSSGTSHSAQFALAAMLKAAADGELDFVADTAEYARRASLTKKMFLDNGFHIVYSKDGDEDVSDGFFYTVGYGEMTGAQLMNDLMLCGICSISLSLTGSSQNGVRICVSQLNRPEQFELLKARLELFKEEHS